MGDGLKGPGTACLTGGLLNMTRKRRLLVNAAIILLIIAAYYFGILHVPEAGGYVSGAAAL
jgi:hypothetical protein